MTKNKETLELLKANKLIKNTDLNRLKKLGKTSRDLKKASKKMAKFEAEYNRKVKIKKIELLKDLNIYNEEYDLESKIYDMMLEVEDIKEQIEHYKSIQKNNDSDKIQQHITLLEWNLIQTRSIYTLELLKNINVSIFENEFLCKDASRKLQNSPKLFINLSFLYDKLLEAFDNDSQLTLLLLTTFFKFIIDSDIDKNYYFIYNLSETIITMKEDKTLCKVMKENFKKLIGL